MGAMRLFEAYQEWRLYRDARASIRHGANEDHPAIKRFLRGKSPTGVVAPRRRRRGPVDAVYAAILRGDPCAYCGGPGGTIDHVVPVSRGGGGDAMNLTSACGSCNASKGAKQLLEFLSWKVAVA